MLLRFLSYWSQMMRIQTSTTIMERGFYTKLFLTRTLGYLYFSWKLAVQVNYIKFTGVTAVS